MHLNTGVRATTPDDMGDSAPDQGFETLDALPSPHSLQAQGRQKSTAAVKSFHPSPFLAKVSTPLTPATFEMIRDVSSH